MVDRVGQQLGNYRIVRYLGRGGFAEVYLGEHIYLKNRQAAIKVLHTQKQLTEEDLEQFLTEANTIAGLEHPNIVRVWDVGIEEGTNTPFLAMVYAPNGTLREHHPKGSVLSLATIISYVKPIAAALQYAHDRRLIHRDVKSENMLVADDNNVLLSDFGIAVTAHSTASQITENSGGTPAYMAPEQLQGKPRPASDQYSLGVVVYEWLSGVLPFDNAFQCMIDPPPPLYLKAPFIYPPIENVVLKALAKDPQDRFETIEAFSQALEQASLAQEATTLPIRTSPRPRFSEGEQFSSTQPVNGVSSVGTIVRTFPCFSRTVAWSPDSRLIAFGRETDGTVYVWNVLEEKEVFKYKGHSAINAVTWAHDGNTILSAGSEGTIQQWNITTKRRIHSYQRHSDFVVALALSPNGKYIASGSGDQKMFIWEVATAKKILEFNGHTASVLAVAWSPDGHFIVSCGYDSVQIWDVMKKQNIFTYYQAADHVAWSPDGSCIASAKQFQPVQVWKSTTGILLSSYGEHPNFSTGAFAWSPDGKYIACGVHEKVEDKGTITLVGKSIHVWEGANGNKVFNCEGHSGSVRAIAWSPDGKYIASCSWDGTIQIWQAM